MKKITCLILRITVFLLFLISATCVFGAGIEKRKKPVKVISPIPLEWEGEYDGVDSAYSSPNKLRKMNMYIDPFSKGDSAIEGTIYIYPVELTDTNGVFGSYRFKGNYDDETGNITVQGVEWIAYPVDAYGQPLDSFTFVSFQGIFDKVSNEINGTTDHGTWLLFAKTGRKDRSLPLKWRGEGYAFNSGTDVRSSKIELTMTINPFSKDEKNVSGIMDMVVYDLNGVFKSKGQVAFKGIYDEKNNMISSEEIGWIGDPAGIALRHFNATISEDMTKMDMWKEHYLFSKFKEADSGLKIKKDNNRFPNARGSFKGSETYKINNDFFETLCNKVGDFYRPNIKKTMDEKWNGSSFALSSTIGLVYEKYLNVLSISQEDTNYYFNLQAPRNNEYFKDVLNYYSLLQNYLIENENEMDTGCYTGEDLQSFLSDLVGVSQKFARKKKVLMLSYDWRGKGHTILITGYYLNEKKKQYELKIYDPNVRNKFSYMIIKDDFSDFKLKGKKGNKIKNIKYSGLSSISSKIHEDNNTGNQTIFNPNNTYIEFSNSSKFTLTGSSGHSLTYNDSISGDMPIMSSNTIYGDNKTTVLIETEDCDSFNVAVNSKNIDLTIYNRKGLKSVKGSQIETIDLSVSGDVKLIGKAFSFKAYSTVDKMINTNEKGMASIAAKAKGEVVIKKGQDFVEATSTQPMSSIETRIYKGTDVVTGKIKGNHESVSVSTTEESNND